MGANPRILQQLFYEAESSAANWGERGVDTFATELQILGPIDTTGLSQPLRNLNPTLARAGGGILHRQGIKAGSFRFQLEAGGHGAAPTGALSATDLYTFLKHYFGQGDTAGVGTTADGTGNATAFGVNGGTFAAGGLCRVGTNDPKDARGNGQPGVVSGLAGGTLTLYNALDATPNAGDVVYPMLQLYPELQQDDVVGLRFQILNANQAIRCYGCWIDQLALAPLDPGAAPVWDVTIGVSDWDPANVTYPQTSNADAKEGAPVSGGSLHLQDLGTATRQTYDYRELSIDFNMELIPLRGPEGTDLTVVRGVRRGGVRGATLRFTIDKDAINTDEWLTYHRVDASSQVFLRGVLGLNAAAGRCMAFSFPKLKPAADWDAPTTVDLEGLNRVPVVLETQETGVTSTDLTVAPYVVGMG